MISPLVSLACDLVAIDSRSFVSNIPVSDRIETALVGFDLERIDYIDPAGVPKRALVAHRGPAGGVAFSGHMDTVPDTGWTTDPWAGDVLDGLLRGLGSTDMKGPIAAIITAILGLPAEIPTTLLITTDEEVDKAGARAIASRSELVRNVKPAAIVVAEPTGMRPVRGHRSHVQFTAVAEGSQAHSSTGKGINANWRLIPFLADLREIFDRLRSDPALQDKDYDPVFSDFNPVIDNHGTATNVTVAKASVRVKYRYAAKNDPMIVIEAMRAAADRAGISLHESREGVPPELATTHPLIALAASITGFPAQTVPFGTDASELNVIAPCVILGPGDIGVAHQPGETVRVSELEAAVPVFQTLATRLADGLR